MKKVLTKLLSLGLATVMFAGCGTSAANTGSNEDAAVEKKEAEVQKEDTSGEKVEITFSHHFSEAGIQNWLDDRVAAFMKENPNITVTQEFIAADSYSQTIQTKIASDDAPDIFIANTGRSSLVKFAEAGHLADLSDIEGLENLNEKILPDGQVDGKQYGITIDQNAYGVFYNKDMFDEYGLEIPETISELEEVCKTLKKNEIQPFTTGYGELWVIGLTLKIYEDILCGPEWFTQHENLEEPFSGDEKFTQVMENFIRYKEYWAEDPFGKNSEDGYDALANGEAAMMINGTWTIDSVQQRNKDCNIRFFAMPTSDDPSGAIVDLAPGSPLCVYNTEDTVKLDAAKKFISFLITEESCNAYATMAKKLSVCPTVDFSFSEGLQDIVDYPSERQFSMAGHERFSDQYNALQNELVQEYAMADEFDIEGLAEALDEAFTTAVQ